MFQRIVRDIASKGRWIAYSTNAIQVYSTHELRALASLLHALVSPRANTPQWDYEAKGLEDVLALERWNTPPPSLTAVLSCNKPYQVARSVSLALVCVHALLPQARALPEGYQSVSGNVQFNQVGDTLNVTTSAQRSIASYQRFNIDAHETVNFNLPGRNSAILNRVTGGTPSQILGKMSSNGQVFITNASGIVFGKSAQVNVGGLHASTLNLNDADFLNNQNNFSADPDSVAGVENQGDITAAPGGYVVLSGANVNNSGNIYAPQGKIAFAVGDKVSMAVDDNLAVNVTVDQTLLHHLESAQSAIENTGTLSAQNGTVDLISRVNQTLYTQAINNQGIIEAKGFNAQGGTVRLENTGDALVLQGGTVDVTSNTHIGGTALILGQYVGATAGSLTDASGATGGGTILLGGDYQGVGTVQNAWRSFVAPSATLQSNALSTGDGGKVIVWADDTTWFYGAINAKGGLLGGNGGFVETSGKHILQALGTVDASAPVGQGGQWLLDPNDITIQTGGGDTNVSTSGVNPLVFDTTTDTAIVTTASIESSLNLGTSVTIQTGTAGGDSQDGDITVATGTTLSKTAGGDATLLLKAHNSIDIYNTTISSSSGKLHLILNSDSEASGFGGVRIIGGTIDTNNGDLTIGGGANPATTAARGLNGGGSQYGVYLSGTNISTGQGNISIRGQGINATLNNAYGIYLNAPTLSTSTGSITMVGHGGVHNRNNHGIYMSGATITSTGGLISLTGTGNGSGTNTDNMGLYLTGFTTITATNNASIEITGTGGTGTTGMHGFYCIGNVDITSESGAITITGVGGTSSGNDADGIQLLSDVNIYSSNGGNVTLTGTKGSGGYDIQFPYSVNMGSTSMSGNIRLNANDLNLASSSFQTTGTITFAPRTASTPIGVNGGAGTLQLGNSILDLIDTSTVSPNLVVFGDNTSGSGAVTITGGWDISARPYDIEVAGGSITTGGITLGSYDLTLNALAGDINVNASSTFAKSTGTDMTLLMKASNSILFNGTAGNLINLTSTSNKLNVTLNSDRDASGAGSIQMAYSTVTSNGGNITLGGGANPLTTGTVGDVGLGIALQSTNLVTGVGDISLRGNGIASSVANISRGVYIYSSSTLNTTTGDISITGVGNNGSQFNRGVFINGGTTSISTIDGNISITGTGGNTSLSNDGIFISSATVQATGIGNISLVGLGGNGTDYNTGVTASNATILSNSGNLTLTGTGGNGSGTDNSGIYLSAGDYSTSTGQISVTGSGGGGSTNRYGIVLDTDVSVRSTNNGNITLTGSGIGGASDILASTSGLNNIIGDNAMSGDIRLNMNSYSLSGLQFRTTGEITFAPRTASTPIGVNGGAGTLQLGNSILDLIDTSTVSPSLVVFGDNTSGSGAVTITGGWDISARPYDLEVAGGSITTGGITLGSYDLTLNALAGDINVDAASTFAKSTGTDMTLLMKASNNILLNGTVGNAISLSSTSNKLNVTLNSDRDASGAGSIALSYTTVDTNNGNIILGGGADPALNNAVDSGSDYYGVMLTQSSLDSGLGDITINGSGPNPPPGNDREGVIIYFSNITSSSGNITITGTGYGGNGFGIRLSGASNDITTTDGSIILTGISNGATVDSNYGLIVGSNIRSLGNGTISLVGTGGTAGGYNYGILVDAAISSLNGDITISGTGGSSAGSYNYGVRLGSGTDIQSNGIANIEITGTAGTGSGSLYGIRIYNGANIISTSGGNITLTGIGQGGSADIYSDTLSLNNIIGDNLMTGDIRLNMNSYSLSGLQFRTTGEITFAPRTASTPIGVNGGAGTLQLGNSILDLIDTSTVSPSLVVFGDNTSGSGAVTLTGGWDISARPYDIEVAGGSITTGGITLGSYDLTLNALAGDVTVNAASTFTKSTGTDMTLLMKASNSILFNGTAGNLINLTSTSNKLNVTLNSDRDASGAGAIDLTYANMTTNNGNIIIGGGGTPLTTSAIGTGVSTKGVRMFQSILATGSGDVSIRGQGVTGGNARYGIDLVSGSQIISTNGAISLTGLGGAGTSSNVGIMLNSGTLIRNTSGSITLIGTGGNAASSTNYGIYQSGTIESLGNGTITLTGQGGSGSWLNDGIYQYLGIIQSVNGDIQITGTGGGSLSDNIGVYLQEGLVYSSGFGNISITGVGGTGATGVNGIYIDNYTVVASESGNLIVTATGQNGVEDISTFSSGGTINLGSVSASGNIRLNLNSYSLSNINFITSGQIMFSPRTAATPIGVNGGAGTLQLGNSILDLIDTSTVSPSLVVFGDNTSGSGAVTITGGWDISARPYDIEVAGGSITTGGITLGSYDLTLNALAGDINMNASSTFAKSTGTDMTLLMKASNSILFNGAGGSVVNLTSTSNKMNVTLNSDRDASGAGAIKLNYTNITSNGGDITLGGGANPSTTPAIGTASNGRGIDLQFGSLSTGAGNITINGTGLAASSGRNGIYSLTNLTTTTGNISLVGTGGNGNSANAGIYWVGNINTNSGAITFSGTGVGTGNTNYGVSILGYIDASTSGTISVSGVGGNGTNQNAGVHLWGILSGDSGNISVVGTGGTGSSTQNHGVELSFGGSIITTSTGDISVSGTGGTTTGDGIYLDGSVYSEGNGSVTLTGNGPGGDIVTSSNAQVGYTTMTGDIRLNMNNYDFTTPPSFTTSGTITFAPRTASTPIGVNGGAGTLQLGNSILDLIDTSTVSPSLVVFGDNTSGSGAVTLTGGWDISARPYDIEVAGGSITTGGITLGSYDLTLKALAGDVSVNSSSVFSKTTGTDMTLDLQASNSVLLIGSWLGADIYITSTSGALNLILNSDRDASGAGAVTMYYSSITTNGGDIIAGGGATPLTTPAYGTASDKYGVRISSLTHLSAGSGDISLNGVASNAANAYGVHVNGNSDISTTSGNITLTGGNSTFYAGIDIRNTSYITSVTGNIEIAGSSVWDDGLRIIGPSGVWTTGSGNVTLWGYTQNPGFGARDIENSATLGHNSMTGNIYIQAHEFLSGSLTTGGEIHFQPRTASTPIGVNGGAGTLQLGNSILDLIDTSTVSPSLVIFGNNTSGSGAVDIATGWDVSTRPYDIEVAGGSITTGGITLGGYDLTLNALAGDVTVNAASTFAKSTGTDMTLLMKASNSILLNGSVGNAISLTATSNKLNLTLNSDRDASGAGAIVIYVTNLTTNSGAVIMGGGANPSTNYATGTIGDDVGIVVSGSNFITAAGDITLNGRGYALGSNNSGLDLTDLNFTTTSGNITLNGLGGNATNFNNGIYLGLATLSTTNGNITLTGQGQGSGFSNRGLLVDSSSIYTQNGQLTLTGTGHGGAADIDFYGGSYGSTTMTGTMQFNMNSYSLSSAPTMVSLGQIIFAPRTAATPIGINGGAGTLQLGNSLLDLVDTTTVSPSLVVFGDNASGSGAVDIATGWDVSTYNFGVEVAGGSITAQSITGGTGNLTLRALSGDVSNPSGTIETTSGDINLYGQNLSVNALNSTSGDILLSATGTINDLTDGADTLITGGNLSLTSGSHVGNATATGLNVDIGGTVSINATGNITLTEGADLNIGTISATGNVSLTAQSGVAGSGMGILAVENGDILLTGSVSGTNVLLEADGNILDGNVGATDIIATAGGTLNAGGWIGTWANPLEIQISGGTMDIRPLGITGLISTVINGSVAPVDTLTLLNSPLGQVWYNGVLLWGSVPVPPPSGGSLLFDDWIGGDWNAIRYPAFVLRDETNEDALESRSLYSTVLSEENPQLMNRYIVPHILPNGILYQQEWARQLEDLQAPSDEAISKFLLGETRELRQSLTSQ